MRTLGSILGDMFEDMTVKRLEMEPHHWPHLTENDLGMTLVRRWRLASTRAWGDVASQLEVTWEAILRAERMLEDPALTGNAKLGVQGLLAGKRREQIMLQDQLRQQREYHGVLLSYLRDHGILGPDYRPRSKGPICWCLGLGGGGKLKPIVLEIVWDEWCTCAMAKALQHIWEEACAEADIESAREAAEIEQQRREATRSDLYHKANLPPKFKDCTLATLPMAYEDGTPVEGRAEMLQALARYGLPTPARQPNNPQVLLDPDAPQPERAWLYLWGAPSRGKTGIAQAVLRLWLDAYREGKFASSSDILGALKESFNHRYTDAATAEDIISYYSSLSLLVWDDLGTERMTDWVQEQVDTILQNRAKRGKTTIITSNYDIQHVAERLGTDKNPKGGERIAERIMEECAMGANVWEVTGPNLRWPSE